MTTTTYRSKLEIATTESVVVLVDAAYGPDRRPVCSICWSQLDFDWGKAVSSGFTLDLLKSKQVEDWTDSKGKVWCVCETVDRCINPNCNGANKYRYLPVLLSFSTPYHPEDLKAHRIRARKYKQGKYGEDGVFLVQNAQGDWKPMQIKLSTRGVSVTLTDPWIWISPGELAEEVPKQYTMIDGRIKINSKSKRYQKLCTWFSDRRVDIVSLQQKQSLNIKEKS